MVNTRNNCNTAVIREQRDDENREMNKLCDGKENLAGSYEFDFSLKVGYDIKRQERKRC